MKKSEIFFYIETYIVMVIRSLTYSSNLLVGWAGKEWCFTIHLWIIWKSSSTSDHFGWAFSFTQTSLSDPVSISCCSWKLHYDNISNVGMLVPQRISGDQPIFNRHHLSENRINSLSLIRNLIILHSFVIFKDSYLFKPSDDNKWSNFFLSNMISIMARMTFQSGILASISLKVPSGSNGSFQFRLQFWMLISDDIFWPPYASGSYHQDYAYNRS